MSNIYFDVYGVDFLTLRCPSLGLRQQKTGRNLTLIYAGAVRVNKLKKNIFQLNPQELH